jgi:hypothetical protein
MLAFKGLFWRPDILIRCQDSANFAHEHSETRQMHKKLEGLIKQ